MLLAGDSVVVFNELMYHPAANEALEWIELHNQMAVDIDLSGWSLADGVDFEFPEGTFIPGGDYLVVARDPAQLLVATGFADALGPYAGQLANNGEQVELRDNSDRLMDWLDYGDTLPWPAAADGSGASLAKIDPDTTSSLAEHWAASDEVGGSPGARNFPNSAAKLSFNELAAVDGEPFWLELVNHSQQPIDLDGYRIATSAGQQAVLPSSILAPGQMVQITAAELGFTPLAGDKLFVYTPDATQILDGVETSTGLQGRSPDGTGRWLVPDAATPGTANQFVLRDEIVINEIMYDHRSQEVVPGQPPVDVAEEWIELFNRGDNVMDLSDWRLTDAVEYVFPADTIIAPGGYLVVSNDAPALATKYPAIDIVGNFTGRLSNDGEGISLVDQHGNPADEVHYYSGRRWPNFEADHGGPIGALSLGSWPAFTDGSGSSLELRDPDADNSVGESWEASRDWSDAVDNPWQTHTYRGVAQPSAVGPDGQWQEFVMGLLSEGALLLDDISVEKDPDGAAVQLIQNGDFDSGNADKWRLIGNHRFSDVIEDPDDPGNFVLRLAAHGSTGHMHNHAETTLANSETIQNGTEYKISFRAKWLAGSNQLNTRLYFNRLAQTTLIARPDLHGTPGEQNSIVAGDLSAVNAGPTYRDFRHAPAVPAVGEPVTVSVTAEDPDGVATMTLHYAVNGEPWGDSAPISMTHQGNGLYTGQIPGYENTVGAIVQFYVEGNDTLGAVTTFPFAGEDSRALYQVDDGRAASNGLHNFRIVLTPADANWLHTDVNLMSNDAVGATVIYGESEAFYDVGVRTKGSERGRVTVQRLGFGVRFNPDHPFRGVHNNVLIDRSAGVGYGQREMYINQTMTHAGGLPGEYNDLIQVIPPRQEHTGAAELQLARFTDVFLDGQYAAGSDGKLFEYELIYYPTSTNDGTLEGLKKPQPDRVVGTWIRNLGDDKENYRWNFEIKNNRVEDDYARWIEFATQFEQSGTAFHEDIDQYIDVDQWLRGFAVGILSGAGDNYTQNSQHNGQFYIRSEDQRVLFFPHDLDAFFSTTRPVVGSNDLRKLIENPVNKRLYYGHLHDIIQTTYNAQYMLYWRDHFASLLTGQDVNGWYNFIVARSNYVLNTAGDSVMNTFPQTTFAITTNGGDPFTVDDVVTTIEGDGWIDVREIRVAGDERVPTIVWTDADSWRVTVPLRYGENELNLEAYDRHGNLVGGDAISVTSTVPDSRVKDFLRISELHYHPPDGNPAVGEPALDGDEFEFVELWNTNPDPAADPLDLTDVRFIDGITFNFTGGNVTELASGDFVLVVRNQTAFEARYGPGLPVAEEYAGRMDNGGEHVWLVDAADRTIVDFTYSDNAPWPIQADGNGSSLEVADFAGDYSHPANWLASLPGGTPAAPGSSPTVDILINEVLSHTDDPLVDTIELYNATDANIDIGGWYLSDYSGSNPNDEDFKKFRIPDGTVVPALGYLVFNESDFNGTGGADPNDFALDGAHGDDVWLTKANAEGNLLRFVDHVAFGAAANGESHGRWPNGVGELYPMTSNTFGDANSGPRVGPVVVSEIMYHPSPPTDRDKTAFPDVSELDLEYIEIHNPGPGSVDLTGWRIGGGIDYEFPGGMSLAQGQVMVILPFDPDLPDNSARASAFRSHYNLHRAFPTLFGGYSGDLDDSGERVQLQRPDEPPQEEPEFVPRLLEDQAFYDEASPWPSEADGGGESLTRLLSAEWGHAASSWMADAASPGRHATLKAATFSPAASGFAVRFNRPFDPADLNLYDVEGAIFGPVDVTLVGQTVGPVAGSVVVDSSTMSFVATGGPLPADTYTLTLRSAANGFKDQAGGLLDGNGDDTPGGDYVRVFTAAPHAVTVGLPDFARGPGQTIDVPATSPHLPLVLNDDRSAGPAVVQVDATINYDPAVFHVTDAILGPDAPVGSTLTADMSTPGWITLTISSPGTPLDRGAHHLVSFLADVPATATYGVSGVLAFSDLNVSDSPGAAIDATADDALHLAAYFGESTGNGEYSGLDAQRVARVAVGLDSGFQTYPATDPVVIADITGNGALSGLDAQKIALQAVGIAPPEIPPITQPLRLAQDGPAEIWEGEAPAEPQSVPDIGSAGASPSQRAARRISHAPSLLPGTRLRQTLDNQASGVGDTRRASPTPEVSFPGTAAVPAVVPEEVGLPVQFDNHRTRPRNLPVLRALRCAPVDNADMATPEVIDSILDARPLNAKAFDEVLSGPFNRGKSVLE